MIKGFKIETIHAFVNTDPATNEEGVVAFMDPITGQWFPMVAADETRLTELLKTAQNITKQTGREIRVLKFSNREDVTEKLNGHE